MALTSAAQLALVLFAFLPVVYQQNFNNSTVCTTQALAAQIVFDFWHESTRVCESDMQNLFKIHKKILNNSARGSNNDEISNLLHNHVSAALMDALFNQLIGKISTKSLTTNPDLEKLINQLYDERDKSFVIEMWRKVLDESSVFMNEEEILQQLVLLKNGDLKLNLFEYLIKKYESQNKSNPTFWPLLTFGVASVLKQRHQSHAPLADPDIGRLLSILPAQLLTIYQSWNYNVSLLNSHYKEYVFSERSNGSMANKRFLFTFLPKRNTFRVKGKFKLQFNSKGQLTIGAPYMSVYKYLVAEEANAFICLDCAALDAGQWWQILWPNENLGRPVNQQFVLIQNVATQNVLCTTGVYDENLVLISTLSLAQYRHDSQCQWQVVKRDK